MSRARLDRPASIRDAATRPPTVRSVASAALALAIVLIGFGPATTAYGQAPVGQGFTVTTADLAFILKQIKIAEAHVANTTSATGPVRCPASARAPTSSRTR